MAARRADDGYELLLTYGEMDGIGAVFRVTLWREKKPGTAWLGPTFTNMSQWTPIRHFFYHFENEVDRLKPSSTLKATIRHLRRCELISERRYWKPRD